MGYYFTRINHQNQETYIGTIHREWDGWMASLTQRTWVWANSGRQWRTRKPGVLQSLGSPRVRHDSATEQQQPTEPIRWYQLYKHSLASVYACNSSAIWIICVAQHIQDPEISCHHRAPTRYLFKVTSNLSDASPTPLYPLICTPSL